MDSQTLIADSLQQFGVPEGSEISVTLSNDLVRLLSTQLYRSPLKAVEELVVNSFDAGASECRLFIPSPSESQRNFMAVYDDGSGMDYEGLRQLWLIGRSGKRERVDGPDGSPAIRRMLQRKQIGKFGIGKLATYTIANRLTYLTRTGRTILTVTIDFAAFSHNVKPIPLRVLKLTNWEALKSDPRIITVVEAAEIDLDSALKDDERSWTLAILEDLKPAAKDIRLGRLTRVLRTAMPLQVDFRLFLNGEEIRSSKEDVERVASFKISELPQKRLESLEESTGDDWTVVDDSLVSDAFPTGISGEVFTTIETLGGKSEDLLRSYGFFVKVRGRLINEDDPLFGMNPKSYKYIYRFRADIDADDLDQILTAPREGVEDSKLKEKFQAFLAELFNEARQRHAKVEAAAEEKNTRRKEHARNYVTPRLVEHPVADAIATYGADEEAAEATEEWFYIAIGNLKDRADLLRRLYHGSLSPESRDTYSYVFTGLGSAARMVRFEPAAASFTVNIDHDFVREHYDDETQHVLEDVVTAEALLEVYLRESRVPAHVIGDILERRDLLLRSLAKDRPYSLRSVAQALRDAAADEHDLEIALVAAARALGFVAAHVSGDGAPDGVARFRDYPSGEKKVILEAKSSGQVPKLSAIDFAGLHEHMEDHKADGCLLVAPDYPGVSRGEWSAAAKRARHLGISCWTIEQLAEVVENAEARHINARDVLDIVLKRFSPGQVRQGVHVLLRGRRHAGRELYRAIIDQLRFLETRLPKTIRTVDILTGRLLDVPGLEEIDAKQVQQAVHELANSSQGAMSLSDSGAIRLHTAVDQLERRVSGLTGLSGPPLRPSRLRVSG